MTPEKIAALKAAVPSMPTHEKLKVLDLLDEWEKREHAKKCRNSLLTFVKSINPDYKIGAHHKILAGKLEKAARGELDRLATAIAPRFGKSLLLSLYFPAWFMGNFPEQKLIISSHTADLAVDFGKKVRNLIDTAQYKAIFPGVALAADSKSAGRWNTNSGGEFFAVGVGGAVAGRGADLLIVDDPFSEQDILNGNYDVFDKVYEWYAYGARTRLMPGGRVVVLHTRWAKNDLIGQLLDESAKNKESDQWDYIEFPAIINEGTDHEKSLWPDQWSLEALRRTRASMPSFQWQAQYQQSPTSQHGALIKKEWWQKWVHEDPPECDYLIMALDAAQEANKRSDFTALTTWGVFYRDSDDGTRVAAIILLNAINKRMEFPALKDLAMREYKTWQPDCFIIEKKSNGAALAQELRRMGLPIQEYTPSRGTASSANTKYARVNSVADIVRSGLVWAPDYKWAEEVIEQCNDFPSGKHDDLCLVAGTQITLASGKMRSIEDVKAGDFVRTPIGPRRVIAAGQTGVAHTVRLRAAGRVLEGTGAHRAATAQGWKRLDTITVADTIKMSATFWSLPWHFLQKTAALLNPFTSTVENTTATQKRSSLRIADTIQLAVAGVCCTEIFGHITTAQSQMGLMSTTKTVIGTTTQSRTLSAFQSKSTARTTHSFNPSSINALNISRISMLFAQKPQSGTEAMKGGHGMQKSLPRLLVKGALRMLHANKRLQSEGKIRTRLCVQNAASFLKRWLSLGSFVPTRARVDGLEESVEKKAVFNLQVEEANCYYANGFLTHNCDTVVMALMRFRSGGFITLPSDDRDDDQPNFRPRRAVYY